MSGSHSATKGPRHYLFSKRWILAYICFYGYFCQYLHRTNLNLAIVCMVRHTLPSNEVDGNNRTFSYKNGSYANTTISLATETNDGSPCGVLLEEQKQEIARAEFNWTKAEVSGMLSSYYYGVVITQVPGGWLAIKFGAKTLITITMLVQGLCSLLVPVLTRISFYLLLTLRILIGLCAGSVSPTYFAAWTKWAPPDERGRLLNLSLLGGIVGTVVSFSTSGLLCAYGFDNGWASIFYIHGAVTMGFLLLWTCCVSNSPNDHPTITEAERDYINEAVGHQNLRKDTKIPWRSILTSPAVLVLAIAHTCYNWSNFTILTTLPLYMSEVLKFDIKQNGLLSSLPHICIAGVFVLVGVGADMVSRGNRLSLTANRRMFQAIAFIGLSGCLFAVTYVTCEHKIAAVVLMCLANSFLGFSQGGFYLNAIDFAPRYSSVIYGLSNSISCVTGTVAPLLAGFLTPNGTRDEWNHVFYVCIGLSIFGTIVFTAFSRSEVQNWAKDDDVNLELEVKAGSALSIRDKNLARVMVSTEIFGSVNSLHSIT